MSILNLPLPESFNRLEDEGYHQDFTAGIDTSYHRAGLILLSTVLLIALGYNCLVQLDYQLLPLPEVFWNALVYATPSALLDAADNYSNPLRLPQVKSGPRTHAWKSEVMRRIIGLDDGGILNTVASASRRRFSILPGVSAVSGGSDARPAGLGNWDNSCYQNSVLQGLASLEPLVDYLADPRGGRTSDDPQDMEMAGALRALIQTLNDPENNGQRIWTPATLKSMSSWQQQDAQEYFSKVLDEIDKEIGKVAKQNQTLKGFEAENLSSISRVFKPRPVSNSRNPLEGLLAQRVCCTNCGYTEGLSMIPFNCLTVPLGRSWEYGLSECLSEYTKLERIEGVECGKCTVLKRQQLLSALLEKIPAGDASRSSMRNDCLAKLAAVNRALEGDDFEEKTLRTCHIQPKGRVSSTKSRQAVIARPPKSLVVHFNRSLFDELTGEMRKNSCHVRFPKLLDLGSWCLGSAGATDSENEEWALGPNTPMVSGTEGVSRLIGPIYELRAVVTHYGRHENGHYICYKKHGGQSSDLENKDAWWRLSDDDVIGVSEENVLGQGGVFMLFFDLVEPAMVIPPTITYPPDVRLAASIALPDGDDSDLSENDDQDSYTTTCESSTATSMSDIESEASDEDQNDCPIERLTLPLRLKLSSGTYGEDTTRVAALSHSNLAMV